MGNGNMLTREEIKKIIPHREPILLIDEVCEMESGACIVAKYRVDPGLDIFRGHFPEEPLFPGVYTIECMAQSADILLLSMEQYAGKVPLFIGVDKVSFKAKITPGAELTIKSEIIKHNTEKAVAVCFSEVFLGGGLAASGEVALAMR